MAWIEQKPSGAPTFERIRGVRVTPSGVLLDPTPFLIHEEDFGCYCNFFGLSIAGGGPDGWVVSSQASSLAYYDIAFAQNEYLIVYGTGLQASARRYLSTLQLLGATALPFAREVTTDGTNFLIAGQWDNSWPPKIEAMLLAPDGSVLVPRFTVKQGSAQSSVNAARVSPAGTLLDLEGGFTLPLASQGMSWPAYDTAPGGGLQYVWNDGLGGAGNARDAYTAHITPTGQVLNMTSVSLSSAAQVEPDFAEGKGIHMIVFRSRSSGAARILAQRLDDNGAALDPEPIEVASGPVQWLNAPSIGRPQVAWNGSVFMVAWSDTINVHARRMNPDGSFVDTSPLTIMTGTQASVGALGNNFLVAGSTSGLFGAPGALRAARIDGVSGAVLDVPPITLSAPSVTARYTHIVTLGDRWLVVWEDKRTDTYGSRVTLGGTVLDPGGIPLVAQLEVEIRPAFMTIGSTTLMAVSTLRSKDSSTGVFRLGIHRMDGNATVCQTDIGFGGPGSSVLTVCGEDLSTGTTADLQLSGAPASTTAFVFVGLVNAPTPVVGGMLVPMPWTLVRVFTTDTSGSLLLQNIPGGGGPFSAYVQAIVVDGAQTFGYGFSNAVQIDFLP